MTFVNDKMKKTEFILKEIQKALGFKDLSSLAMSLNYHAQTPYKWIERDKFPYEKFHSKYPQIRKTFLETGEGPVTNPQSSLPVESLTAREPQSFYGTPSDRDILMMRVITDLSEKVDRLGDKIDRMASERKS